MKHTAFRTSDTDPIQVHWLQGLEDRLPPGSGKIGLTFAPGKKGPSFYGNPWERDLEKDLIRLRNEFRTSLLITLLEEWEMDRYKIPSLLQRAQQHGIKTMHEPVVDQSTPTIEQARRVADQAFMTARNGENVVIHCLGGRGRAGTMGACCYIALGLNPNQALAMVRASRKDAVETDSQRSFLFRFHSSITRP